MDKKEFTGVWIPRHIIEDEDLSMSEMIIYSEIACFEICYKSNEKLGERYGLKANTISIIISKLLSKGYIKKLSFDGRNRQLKALRDAPIKGRLLKKSKADFEKNDTIDNNIDNKDILLADKSANDNLNENKPNIKIQDLYEKFGLKTQYKRVNQWQDKAVNAIKLFPDIKGKESSVFKCFKDNTRAAETALSDCKELGKYNVLYFLKVYNAIKK